MRLKRPGNLVFVCAFDLSCWISGWLTTTVLLGSGDQVPHLEVIAVACSTVMVLHGATPAFLGMCGGNNDMKLASMVTLHWREWGQSRVVSNSARLKEGSNQRPPDKHWWCGNDHCRCCHLPCLGGYRINNDQEG